MSMPSNEAEVQDAIREGIKDELMKIAIHLTAMIDIPGIPNRDLDLEDIVALQSETSRSMAIVDIRQYIFERMADQ